MPGKPRLEVERIGNRVTLVVDCLDEYTAMKLYDEICISAKKGIIVLDVVAEVSPEPLTTP